MSIQERYSMIKLKQEIESRLANSKEMVLLRHTVIEPANYVFFLELKTVNPFKSRKFMKSGLIKDFADKLSGEVAVWKSWRQGSTLIRIKIARKD